MVYNPHIDMKYHKEIFTKKLTVIDGIGDILAETIFNGMQEDRNIIEYLMERGYKKLSDEIKYDDERYTIVVTGDLKYHRRDILKTIIEKRGHKMTGGVTKKTNYLITNDTESGTVKNKKAKELGVPILTEDEFYDLLKLDKE
jgi:DNA ligase (NAD+)